MKQSVNELIDFLTATHPGVGYRIILHDPTSTFAEDHDWTVYRGYALIVEDRPDYWLLTACPTITDDPEYQLDTATGHITPLTQAA